VNQAKNILSIQAIRGIAAALVVFAHAQIIPSYIQKIIGKNFGAFGVDIFFVISGFIMVYISKNNFGQKGAAQPFILHRLIRIMPMYLLVTLIVFLIIIPSGLYLNGSIDDDYLRFLEATKEGSYLLSNLLLIPYFYLTDKSLPPITGVTWTLIYEMFFYYIFCFLLMTPRKVYLQIACIIFSALTLSAYAIEHFHLNGLAFCYINFYGNDLILEFIFGCFIAEQYLAGKTLTINVSWSLLMLGILEILLSYRGLNSTNLSHFRSLYWGLPSALIVFSLLSLEKEGAIKIPRFLTGWGDASYSTYLTHYTISLVIINAAFKKITNHFPAIFDSLIINTLIVCMICILCIKVGQLSFKYIEKPMTAFLKKHLLKPKRLSSGIAITEETTDDDAAQRRAL